MLGEDDIDEDDLLGERKRHSQDRDDTMGAETDEDDELQLDEKRETLQGNFVVEVAKGVHVDALDAILGSGLNHIPSDPP